MKFETLDSGVREEYDSGMRRDTQEGKPAYSLIDRGMLKRWAELMTRGAEKYGRRNWELAESNDELERFIDSAFRHFIQWLDGEPDEDHAAAVFFNIAAAEYVKKRMELTYYEGKLVRGEYSEGPVEGTKTGERLFVWMEDQPGYHTHDSGCWAVPSVHVTATRHDGFRTHKHTEHGVQYYSLNPLEDGISFDYDYSSGVGIDPDLEGARIE